MTAHQGAGEVDRRQQMPSRLPQHYVGGEGLVWLKVLDEPVRGHRLEVRRKPLRESPLPDRSVFDSPEQGLTNVYRRGALDNLVDRVIELLNHIGPLFKLPERSF